ncbi:MAG: hypothetical protein VB017_07900, partial [Endomicrobiaceae bacterium]|nr:hypothetical protein [Endomicrobiaceae bacterium]
MNNKIIRLLSSLVIVIFAAVFSYAADYKVFSAEIVFSSVTPASITHSAITTVSSINGILKAKAYVDFGSNNLSAVADLRYYINGQSLNISTVSKGAINHRTEFYIATPKLNSSDTSVSYQLKITLQDSSGSTSYLYWPSSSTYQSVNIVNSSSNVVTASGGGTVKFESGNQQYGDTEIVFSSGTFATDQTITITELTLPSMSPSYSGGVGRSQMVALYSVTPLWSPALTTPARATFYYGTETSATRFELMRSDDNATWEKVSDITIDLSNKTISAYITKAGYYAIYTSSNLSDNDYRPAKRVVVQGRDVFKFNNLSDGDSVKIYNVNGKRIREIKSG